jgi:tripartite-type tricarboxylate transporter receptor subunit TctC
MSRRPMLSLAITALVLAILAVSLSGQPSAAQTCPAGKITIVVGFAPGGFADTTARFVAEGLRERLRQTIVVENRAGAGGNIVASKPFSASDLKTVAIVTSNPEALATSPRNPADSLSAFIKAMNGKVINFGSAGTGTGSHIEAEYFFKNIAKVPAQHIPFQGGAPAATAVMGNQVDLLAATLSGEVAGQIRAGNLKGLGIAADKRSAAVPDVPTFAEQGFPNFTAASWVGFFAPAKTDPRVLETLNLAINQVMTSPDIQARLVSLGFDPLTGSQAEADKMFNAEIRKWGDMVKALNLSNR